MEMFELVASLTLDSKEYERELRNAERSGRNIDDVEASLGLDTSEFDRKVQEAENVDVSDPDDPDLGLNIDPFKTKVEEAEKADVDNPEEPELSLDPDPFYAGIGEAESEEVQSPEPPQLKLDAEEFYENVSEANSVEVDSPESPSLGIDARPFFDGIAEAESVVVEPPESPHLEINTQDYESGLDEAVGATEHFSGAVADIFDNLKSILATGGLIATIGGVVNALNDAVDLARQTGDNIDKSSRAMSISTDAYQEWSHVLEINGASITDLNRGLMNMRKLMGGGDAPEEFTNAMVKLGLATQDAEGNVTSQFSSTEEMLKAAMKALADFDTSTSAKLAERDFLAQALFGRGGTKLNAMFDGTSEDIDGLIQQAHDLGLVMSEDAVAQAAAYNDAVTNMNASINAFKMSIGETLLPIFTDLANKVATIVAFFNPRNSETKLSEQMKGIDEQTAETILDIEATAGAAESMIDKLFSMGDATKLTAEQQAEWKSTADWLIKNIPSLSEVIDLDTMSINGNKEEIYKTIEAWRTYAIERAKIDAVKEKQEALMKKTTEWLKKETEAAEAEAEAEKAQYKVEALLKRDFENAPESLQKRIMDRFHYADKSQLDWSHDSVWLGQLANALGPNYTEWGFSSAGSQELWDAMNQTDNSKALRQKASELKAEVEAGRAELEHYSEVMDNVVNGLIDAGEEIKDATTKADEFSESSEAAFENAETSAEEAGEQVEALGETLENLPDDSFESTEDSAEEAKEEVEALEEALSNLPDEVTTDVRIVQTENGPWATRHSHKKGLWSVPYDGYPASLDRGERVLTASQARRYDNEGAGINAEETAAIVAQTVSAVMERVNVYLGADKVGNLTTRRVNKNIKATNNARLRALGG